MKYNVYARVTRECSRKDLVKIDVTEDPDAYMKEHPDHDFLIVPFGAKIGLAQVTGPRKRC